MKLTIKTPKPRNPLVALARMRKAGSHQVCRGAERRESERTLKRELAHLTNPSP